MQATRAKLMSDSFDPVRRRRIGGGRGSGSAEDGPIYRRNGAVKTFAITAAALGLVAMAAGTASAQMSAAERADLNRRILMQADRAAAADSVESPGGVGETRGVRLQLGDDAEAQATGQTRVEARARPEPEDPPATAAATGTPDYDPVDDAARIDFSITFETDSAFIRASAEPLLNDLCEVLTTTPEFADLRFRIIGHADRSGGAAYNRRLSAARAEEVKRHLIDECGMDGARLEAVGVGFAYPLPDVPPVAEAQRRVELQVAPGSV